MQVCLALKYMHDNKVMHRDIKPENILVFESVAKLCDLGCAVYAPEKNRDTFCGTMDYVSPEVIKGLNYDKSVDLWGIGVLIFELSSGHTPFEGIDK